MVLSPKFRYASVCGSDAYIYRTCRAAQPSFERRNCEILLEPLELVMLYAAGVALLAA